MAKFIVLLCIVLGVRLVFFYLFQPPKHMIQKNPVRETTIFTDIKKNIKQTYDSYLPQDQSNLLMGIVFGEKDLDKASTQKFISTGVLHVVAASGMNVSMLTSFLLSSLLVFFRRQHALILTVAAVIFYTALADFQPSIIRAAIMSVVAIGAGLAGRQNTSILALFFAAFVMVFWDPAVIVSISFILSFAATLGIILLHPILKQGVLKNSIFEDFRTTFSAQIATTPILLFFFGTYSPISILVNFLVLWTVPPLMALGGAAALVSFVSPILAIPLTYLCLPLLLYFKAVVDFFAQSAVPIALKNTPWTIVAGYYLVVLSIIIVVSKNKNKVP